MEGMDLVDFAVMTKVQELYDRFGLKPYDMAATLDYAMEHPTEGRGVRFEIMGDFATTSAEYQRIEKRSKALLDLLGVADKGILGGGEQDLLNALDKALKKAPAPSVKR